jgi:acyl carrier protein
MTNPRDALPQTPLEAIAVAVRQVLHDTGREARPVEPQMLLGADLGLDSLDLAQTIVLLERALGVDPFRTGAAGPDRPPIRTVADLAAAYRRPAAD